jgi:hypothetical protein
VQASVFYCGEDSWHGRKAYKMGNGLVDLVTLMGGGHIAEFRFTEISSLPTLNPLWTPPWKTIDPHRYRAQDHAARYGPITEGKLLSGIAGHNLCMDYFGSPSPEEAELGLSQHGEAPNSRWHKVSQSIRRNRVSLTLSLRLPGAGLRFRREIALQKNLPAAYFKETVTNERKCDHFFHWTEHVTLGPPFISSRGSAIFIPGTRGITFPHDYDEGKSLLVPGRIFRWPFAPAKSGKEINLEHVLLCKGLGLVASVLIDPRREWGYIAALNTKRHLLIAYCFRREDFPWVAVWEENRAISAVPWSKRTEARGLEFGTTPIPSSRRETFRHGNLFETATITCIPARGRKTVEYFAFLAQLPSAVKGIRDIRCGREEIVVYGNTGKSVACIPASPNGSKGRRR